MDDIRKGYIKDANRCLTPVYIPYYSFAFFINGVYFTDPELAALFDLKIIDAKTDLVVAGSFAELSRVSPFLNALVPVYMLHCTFSMPKVPNGEYYFRIVKAYNTDFKLESNIILVENDITDTTSIVEYTTDAATYGFEYNLTDVENGFHFRNIFRLPITQIDLQFDREIKTYRNVTDRRLRTIQSFRDANVKIEAYGFDDLANEALSAAIEHKTFIIDGLALEVKSALTINTNLSASLNKSTFEAYKSGPETQYGIFNGYGQTFIFGGNASDVPKLTYSPE